MVAAVAGIGLGWSAGKSRNGLYVAGDFGLNQGAYTTMTYSDGWPLDPHGKATDRSA